MKRYCQKCELPHLDGPLARPCYYDTLRAALGDVEVLPLEDKTLRWLARLDLDTVKPIAALFERARKAGASR